MPAIFYAMDGSPMASPAPLFFDLDGTIINPRRGILDSFRCVMTRFDLGRKSDEELALCIGPPIRQTLIKFLGDAARGEEALAVYRDYYQDIGIFRLDIYSGIEDALRILHEKGHRLFICTAKPRVYASRIAEHFGFAKYFEAIHGPELDGRNEKKAVLMRYMLDQHGLNPAGITMIGDREHDIHAAREHGLDSIGVLWGFGTAEELRSAGAQQLCAAPDSLVAMIPHAATAG